MLHLHLLAQVKAAEIVASSAMAAGLTLRFPRVEAVRADKAAAQATTLEELAALRQRAEGKLFGQVHLAAVGAEQPRRKRARVERAGLGARFVAQELAGARVDSHLLAGQVIVVEPNDERLKGELERAAARHGGRVEQNVRPGVTTVYVHTGMTLKGRLVAERGQVDVVAPAWLLDATPAVPPPPHLTEAATAATRASWAATHDEWHDAFATPATRASLRHSMERVAREGGRRVVSRQERREVEEEAGLDMFMFRGLVVAVVGEQGEQGKKGESLVELQVRFLGGEVAALGGEGVTHVVVQGRGEEARREREARVRSGRRVFHLVSEAWVEECVRRRRRLPEAEFAV